MKRLKTILRYYVAGAFLPVAGGLIWLVVGYSLNIWELIFTGWFALLMGLFGIGPGLAIWYYNPEATEEPRKEPEVGKQKG